MIVVDAHGTVHAKLFGAPNGARARTRPARSGGSGALLAARAARSESARAGGRAREHVRCLAERHTLLVQLDACARTNSKSARDASHAHATHAETRRRA